MIVINGIDVDIIEIICGMLFMLAFYTLSILLNIRIQKGEYGLTSGRFKLYFIAAIFGVSCNMFDFIMRQSHITDKVWIVKIILLFYVLHKIYILNHSGNPLWYTDDEDEMADNPFESTVGMSFCIMVAYTSPIVVAILMSTFIELANSLTNLEKYKFIRFFPICIINIVEITIATILVNLSYGLSFFWALFVISLIGAVFNIVVSAINDIVFDSLTGDRFFQE